MKHRELIHSLSTLNQLPATKIDAVLETLSHVIQNELMKGNSIQIDNIGTFHVMDSNNMNDNKRVKLKAHATLKAAINEELIE